MAFGFPAYHEERVRYDCSRNDLMDAALEALDDLEWNGRESDRWRLSGSTGWSFWGGWGETIRIRVEPGPVLFIRSQCLMPTQCFDWGKNARNVRTLLDKLDEVLDYYDREDRRRLRDAMEGDEERAPRRLD